MERFDENLDAGPGAVVRTLKAEDLDRLVKIDQAYVGRNRRAWFEGKLKRALAESSVVLSLGAEKDGTLVGALMGAVQYGEFGMAEPVAILDTILVDKAFVGQGIAQAMMEQLLRNLAGLRIETIRTEVAWDDAGLLGFLNKEGFKPVPRLVLERSVG